MEILFYAALALYFLATVFQFAGVALKKDVPRRMGRWAFLGALLLHTGYTVWRGAAAGRLPLANQFEFASAFAWAAAALGLILYGRLKQEWLLTAAMPAAFLILSYAAFQPMRISELPNALRSVWFAVHIGSAAVSYAAFAVSGGLGVSYLVRLRRGEGPDAPRMQMTDYLGYRLICLGMLLLTVVIFSGAIWAEQAWGKWWSWDPKETWALITWLFYAVYLHQRLRMKWQGKRTAWLAIIALLLVLFTFAGVNMLFKGLHSYA